MSQRGSESGGGSDVLEGHSETEERREEYFGEAEPLPIRRSPRLGQQDNDDLEVDASRKDVEDQTLSIPEYPVEAIWIKLQDGRPLRVWVARLGDTTMGYGADGSVLEMPRRDLAKKEVPFEYVQRHWNKAIPGSRCFHRALTRKFFMEAEKGSLPTKEEWEEWLRPIP